MVTERGLSSCYEVEPGYIWAKEYFVLQSVKILKRIKKLKELKKDFSKYVPDDLESDVERMAKRVNRMIKKYDMIITIISSQRHVQVPESSTSLHFNRHRQ